MLDMILGRSVDKIISSVTKAITQLEEVGVIQNTKGDTKESQASDLMQEVELHRHEATRAGALAAKFKALVEV